MSKISREEKAHINQLIRDLVQGDSNLPSNSAANANDGFDQIPYIVKQVFQAGRQDGFSEHLGIFISRKEVEIERMCGLHYQVRSAAENVGIRSVRRSIVKGSNRKLYYQR